MGIEFSKETVIIYECTQCNVKEKVTLGDLPATPKGFFILPLNVQCIKCLRLIPSVIRDEDQPDKENKDAK